jgi:hypothetical protein
MRRFQPRKCYTLALCLFHCSRARALDDLAEMLIKRMRKTEQKAKKELEEFRRRNQKRMDSLISRLGNVAKASKLRGKSKKTLSRIQEALGSPYKIIEECELYLAYVDNNHYPFYWRYLKSHRQSLFETLKQMCLHSTSQDQKLIRAISFLLNQC